MRTILTKNITRTKKRPAETNELVYYYECVIDDRRLNDLREVMVAQTSKLTIITHWEGSEEK